MRTPSSRSPALRRWGVALAMLGSAACDDAPSDTVHDGAVEDVEKQAADAADDDDATFEQDACQAECGSKSDADAGAEADAARHDAGGGADGSLDANADPEADANAAPDAGDEASMDGAAEDASAADNAAPVDSSAEPDAATHDAGPMRAVTIRFKAEVSGQEFACGRTYANQGTPPVDATPSDFRFFLQDLRLITAQGVDVAVSMDDRSPWQNADVALVDFEDGQGNCASGNPETNVTVTGKVPDGTYAGVAFRIGVPARLNHGNPAQAPAPLKNAPSTLWSWLLGYKFLLAELQQVVPSGQAPGRGLVHVGSTACSGNAQQGSVLCAHPNRSEIRFMSFDVERNVVVVDLGTVHAQTDISLDSQCHSSGAACSAPFAAVGVDFGSGQALTTYPAFAVR